MLGDTLRMININSFRLFELKGYTKSLSRPQTHTQNFSSLDSSELLDAKCLVWS